MIVEPTTSTWFEAKCAQDVDAMLRRLEELGPSFQSEKKQHGDDETYNTETSTVLNESSFEGNDGNSDVSSDREERNHRIPSEQENQFSSAQHDDDEEEDEDYDDEFDDEIEDKPVDFIDLGHKRKVNLPSKDELKKLSNEELLELLEHMRERLAKSLVDLSGERFIRRKKEKTLEKLAKELCKRITEGEMKERQIRDLTCTLKKTTETLAELKRAEEKAKAECEAIRNEHETFKREQKAKMDAQVAHYTRKLQSLRESYNAELCNGQQMKATMTDMEIQHDQEIRKYKMKTVASICVATLAVAVACGVIKPREIRDRLVAQASAYIDSSIENLRDNMCGPVPNGFTLPSKSFTFDAPWWAPDESKEKWFSLCGERTRSRMHWDWINNKLSTYSLDKEGKPHRLWTFRVPNARVMGDRILIEAKDGKVQRELLAPWSD